jgi:two-component system, sensor histidine kinase
MELSKIEKDRIKRLHDYQILDTIPEENFDELTHLIAYICEVPIAAISLIDANSWLTDKS